MKLQTDVCIVGCGPAGALLGLLLAKQGVSTIVIERSSLDDRNFRGEHINLETETILKEHKLFEKVEELGLLKMKRVEFFNGKQLMKSILPNIHENHVGIHVPQSHLLHAIIKESYAYKNYCLLKNTTATQLLQNEKGFFTGVKANKDGKDITISCSLVVGADGRYSKVRKLAKIAVTKMRHGYDVLWAKIPAPKGWNPTTRMLYVGGHQLALFTQTGGFIQIGWNIDEGSFAFLKKSSIKPFIEPLIESFPELGEIVSKHLQSWKNFVCLNVFSSRNETWIKDGLVLIGDSAHTMTPTGAIGINCAMKDAHILAPILAQAIFEKNVAKEQFIAYEIGRRAEIEKQQKMQIEKERSFSENFKTPRILG